MESILPHLGIPLGIVTLWIGIAIANRIANEDGIENTVLRLQNKQLSEELKRYRSETSAAEKKRDTVADGKEV